MGSSESVEQLYKDAAKGSASDSVLQFLKDWFEIRKEQSSRKMCNCPPEIGAMVDARAEMKEVRRMEQKLLVFIKTGEIATEELEKYKKKEA